jgi:hypothetical protein
VGPTGSLRVKTLPVDNRLAITYGVRSASGLVSAPATVIVLVSSRKPPVSQLQSCRAPNDNQSRDLRGKNPPPTAITTNSAAHRAILKGTIASITNFENALRRRHEAPYADMDFAQDGCSAPAAGGLRHGLQEREPGDLHGDVPVRKRRAPDLPRGRQGVLPGRPQVRRLGRSAEARQVERQGEGADRDRLPARRQRVRARVARGHGRRWLLGETADEPRAERVQHRLSDGIDNLKGAFFQLCIDSDREHDDECGERFYVNKP